jgi:uncharacterized protein
MIKNDQNSFQCARCGTCCKWPGYVRLQDNEIANIADYLGLDIHKFTEQYTELTLDRRNLTLIEKENGSCIFFHDTSGCTINSVKPEQCINFPIKWNFEGWEKICKGNRMPDTE